MDVTRKSFLGGALALAGCAGLPSAGGRIAFGVASAGPGDAGELRDLGWDFWEGGVQSVLMPGLDEKAHRVAGDPAKWDASKKAVLSAPLPLASCNGFFPWWFRLTGPKRAFEEPLAYADLACRRADEIGLPVIVFGSGGVRNAPKGYPLDRANAEFLEFCKRLAERIADRRVTIVLEPLRAKETNVLNFVREGLDVVRGIGSPRVRVLADFFHMVEGGESMESIRAAAASELLHCHVAERGTRMAPGTDAALDAEFVPFFAALRAIGYRGGVSCECGWPQGGAVRAARAKALAVLKAAETGR